MRKKLSLLVLLFVFTFFMSGSAYAVNVGNGTELDIEFNNITTSGTLTITTDTIVAVSSLTAAGKEVVFEGFQPGGTTIDLGNIYTFLNIETSTMTLNNISVTKSSGSAVVSSASYISASSSGTFDNNISYASGGAFVLQNTSTAAFSGDFDFTNNTASTSGGAIYATNSFLDFTNANETNFSGNTCGLGAGAIFLYGKSTATFSGKVNFSNNTGNTVNSRGGAVYVWSNSHLDFTNASSTTFNSNQAYGGGALYLWTNSTVIFGADTLFINNYASGASGDDSGGGAIHLDYAYMEAQDIKFINNKAANRGGALFLFDDSEAVFKGDTLFENNASAGAGGAIYIQGEYSKLHFTDTSSVTFRSNISVKDSGGALAVYSSTAIFDGAVDFIGNKTLNSNYSKGGALYLEDSDASFTSDVLFKDNESAMETMPFDGGQGGGFAAVSTDARNVTFSSAAVFDGNKAGWGGGFYLQNVGVTFADKVLFSSNTTNGFGGGFYAENSWGNIQQDINFNSYAEFRGNKAYAGGGFVVNGNNVMQMSFEDALFVENSAIFAGGAFEAFDIVFDFNGIVRFSSNTSDGHAGAIYTTDSSIGFNGHTVFEYNEAKDGSGGAVDISTADVKFNNNVYFSSNTASDSGGAINITDQGSVFFDIGYAEFFRNKAGNFGGAINTFDSSVHSSTNSKILFNENAADMGGAIFASVGEFQLTNPHFYNNTASTFGGAIASSGTSVSSYAVVNILSLDRGGNDNKTVFRGNEAAGQNNAIYLSDFSSMTFNTGLNASVEMYDKISAQSSTSYLIISGDGKFNMAADADIENLYINNGNFYLRGGRTLNVTNMNISDGSVFNMADHTALDSSTSTTFNTLNVTTFNIDGKLAVDGINNDGAVNITAGTVNLGETSSLDVLTNITNINYKKKIYKVFYYGILNSSFSAVTINDGLDVDDLSVKNYFKREGNWLLYILEGKGTSTAFTSLAGLSYNSMQVAKLFDSVTTESGRINATEDFLNDIFMLDSQSDNVKKQGLSDMSGYFIANVIRSAGLMSDNGEVYDRIKYQDFKTIDMDGIWVQARGQYNKISSNDNSPEDYKDTMTGFTAGWDKMHDEFGLLIGVFGKYNNNTIEQSAENSADVQGFGAGVYSGLVRDEWELKALISGNFDTFETHRKIRYLDRTADGKFDAFTFGFDVEFGVKTYVTESIYFKPFGGIETKAVSYNGFKEENAAGVGLDIKGDIYTRGLGRIGLIVASDDDQKFEWNAGLQGKYLFVGDEPEIESQFLGSAIKFSSRGAKEGNTLLGVSGGVS